MLLSLSERALIGSERKCLLLVGKSVTQIFLVKMEGADSVATWNTVFKNNDYFKRGFVDLVSFHEKAMKMEVRDHFL